ncbi:proliferating cell nuclear antigen (pcna) [Candidatus Micrarchaeota archaeon CG_4_10_14_0_2_um_filter_55_9]|nr:MAG: proliferating cell nuclear antigen (pcna) [Candidatus Micrarchaeota archaeon CG1_02_55_41]PIZ91658.1 MAG: proliferating cell nuclear antigen (pcna) [Candidatus Micrarchaeota archaeon CG_4_10_14_0_2_um_filter_55_9]PJD01601.1 MAG: proliferating cell nuclear antigen (pcna) [Candidatus Micrarchaeota archaeon CG10_big_fil_rev_8_21_14_0_10_54_18]
MELVIEDAKFFKQCVDAIVNLVDEGSFEASKDGLKLRTMDPSQIAMVDFSLESGAFKKFDCGETRSLTVNLADFNKVLARTRPDEKLTLTLDEKNSRLALKFKGASTRNFKLPLLESSAAFPREPKIAFEATIKLNGGEFKSMLRDAGLLSSHVTLKVSGDSFFVEAHGDSGDLEVESKKGKTIIEIKGEASAMYPYEYLDDVTRACPDDAEITLEMKTDAPIRTSYEIGKAKLAYFLAPRVES